MYSLMRKWADGSRNREEKESLECIELQQIIEIESTDSSDWSLCVECMRDELKMTRYCERTD